MLWTYAASRQLWSGADLMYTDEPRWGTEREAHKLKRPTGPTSTKANLDGEIIQLNPSKHCWRPRQTLAWRTRFTRGPVPTPLPAISHSWQMFIQDPLHYLSLVHTNCGPWITFATNTHDCNSTKSLIGIRELPTDGTYARKTARLYCVYASAKAAMHVRL